MIKINKNEFDDIKIDELKEKLIMKIKKDITKNKKILKNWIKSSKCFYKSKCLSLSQTIEDMINYSIGNSEIEDKYYILEYLKVRELYDEGLKVKEDSNDKENYLKKLYDFWALAENKHIDVYIPKVSLLCNLSNFKIYTSGDEDFEKFLKEDLFKVFLDFNDICKDIFDYKHMSPFRVELIRAMKLKVCPYCNENNIHDLDKTILADLDHFLLKSHFPLFSLTISNFIPSCLNCNRTLKGTYAGGIINPYIEGFDENATFEFETPPVSFSDNSLEILFTFKKQIDQNVELKIFNSIEIFELIKRYNHENIVNEAKNIYFRSKALTGENIPPLYRESMIGLTREEQYNLFLGFDPNVSDISNLQYGKLKLDILKYMTKYCEIS